MLLSSSPIIKKEYEKIKGLNKKIMFIIIQNPNDKASELYIKLKAKKCKELGIEVLIFKDYKTVEDVKEFIQSARTTYIKLGYSVGVMIQKPAFDKELDEIEDYIINPYSDVDGLTSLSLGKIVKGNSIFEPATAKGIIDLLNYYDIEIESKNILIVNRSSMLGKPLAMMLLNKDATVTIAHSKTKNLKELCKNADIVIIGISNPNIFTPEYFKDKTTIIDVSTNIDDNGKSSGDIKHEYYDILVNEKECNLTPVPGGVGPMTVLTLMKNILNTTNYK